MEKYKLLLRPSAVKDLEKLRDPLHHRVISALERLQTDPVPKGSLKIEGRGDLRRIRIGDYRILYEIESGESLIRIFRIVHRREAYR